MNNVNYTHDEDESHDDRTSEREANAFKKLKRPELSAKRSKTPERLRGMHRRRRKRMNW